MKIGIDAGGLGITDERLKVGVYHIVKDIITELSKIDKKNTYLLYSFHPIEPSLMKQFGKNMKNIIVKPMRGWMKIGLPLRLFLDKPDVFIGANQALPYRLPLAQYKTITIFYDIAFETLPQLYAYAGDLHKLIRNSQYAAQHSDTIIAISQKTKEDMEKFYGISGSKIIVSYPPITVGSTKAKKEMQHPYFLFVGAFKKSKNVPVILSAFGEFIKRINKPYNMVLIGGDRWLDPEIKSFMDKLPSQVKSLVKIIPATADKEELAQFYRGAVAFVSPSLYEGFGLPLIEAMLLDCPVISSKEGSIPEVVGDAGILVDYKSVKELSDAMEKVAKDQKMRNAMVEGGKRNIKRFKKDAIAKTIYSIIGSYEKTSHS